MYKIIGADQKEYGPVSADQMHQWIREGRVNARTQVQPEGATGWQALGTLPEFAAAFPTTPTYAPGGPLPGGVDTSLALQMVQGPAIALIVVAIICFLSAGAGLVMNILGVGAGAFGAGQNPELERIIRSMNSGALGIIMNVFGLAISGLILMGALKMKKLESYGLVMTATICSMLPCISPCCCVGLPIGIWILIVLSKPEVKSAFH